MRKYRLKLNHRQKGTIAVTHTRHGAYCGFTSQCIQSTMCEGAVNVLSYEDYCTLYPSTLYQDVSGRTWGESFIFTQGVFLWTKRGMEDKQFTLTNVQSIETFFLVLSVILSHNYPLLVSHKSHLASTRNSSKTLYTKQDCHWNQKAHG